MVIGGLHVKSYSSQYYFPRNPLIEPIFYTSNQEYIFIQSFPLPLKYFILSVK